MKLNPSPFSQIKAGTKTIEIRLNDEKRRLLNIGDELVFTLITDEAQSIKTEVVNLHVFKTFKELCESFPAIQYGSESSDEWELMYKYYSKEDEEKWGVLGIEVKVL